MGGLNNEKRTHRDVFSRPRAIFEKNSPNNGGLDRRAIQLGSSTITPSASVRNLGVIFDYQLTFKEHIAKTARSCRFALHNIRKIRPFLTEHAAQLLVQALVISRLDYCNALLAGLPSNTIKPLQMIQNAAARLVFNEPKLHLSLSPCTGYQLQLASSSRH